MHRGIPAAWSRADRLARRTPADRHRRLCMAITRALGRDGRRGRLPRRVSSSREEPQPVFFFTGLGGGLISAAVRSVRGGCMQSRPSAAGGCRRRAPHPNRGDAYLGRARISHALRRRDRCPRGGPPFPIFRRRSCDCPPARLPVHALCALPFRRASAAASSLTVLWRASARAVERNASKPAATRIGWRRVFIYALSLRTLFMRFSAAGEQSKSSKHVAPPPPRGEFPVVACEAALVLSGFRALRRHAPLLGSSL
ncbi:hypothetical protein MTO96_011690 [Rhipicephalus appendiculatus]